MLCAPAVTVMLLVTAYPIGYAVWLSTQRYGLRFPDDRGFVGFDNYSAVLGNELWWQDLVNTLVITVVSVIFELILGFALAFVMHRALFGRGMVRSSILVPYGIITVVAAFAWRFAFDPTTGFVNQLANTEQSWFTEQWSAYFVIILTEIWKTTPFMSLLLLAGFTLVPDDVVNAARVDGASTVQRLRKVIIPLMKPAILVALLFRTLDAFRIFDSVFVMIRGAQNTENVSILGVQDAHHPLEPRSGLCGLGARLRLRLDHRLPLREGVRRLREGVRRQPGPAARGGAVRERSERTGQHGLSDGGAGGSLSAHRCPATGTPVNPTYDEMVRR
jgi:multiple sugar transport system permease protein